MGNNLSQDLAEMDLGLSLRDSIRIQLQGNHYPPVPLSMVDACIDAINFYNNGEYHRNVDLPEGVSWKGNTHAPAYAIIEIGRAHV